MPHFAFEAIGPSGALMSGRLEARSRNLALDELIAAGQTPVSLKETSNGGRLGISRWTARHAFDYRLFLRELGVLLKAGLSVERALHMLVGIASNDHHRLRIGQILERVRGGAPLSLGFSAAVSEAPAQVSRLMEAGEASGKLADIVIRIAQSLDRAKALRDRLISGLTYPAVLLAAMVVVLWVVFATVLPRLVPMFEDAGASLPESTALLLSLDLFLQAYGWWLVFFALGLAGTFVLAMRNPRTRLAIDGVFLRIPLFFGLPPIIKPPASAATCRRFSTAACRSKARSLSRAAAPRTAGSRGALPKSSRASPRASICTQRSPGRPFCRRWWSSSRRSGKKPAASAR